VFIHSKSRLYQSMYTFHINININNNVVVDIDSNRFSSFVVVLFRCNRFGIVTSIASSSSRRSISNRFLQIYVLERNFIYSIDQHTHTHNVDEQTIIDALTPLLHHQHQCSLPMWSLPQMCVRLRLKKSFSLLSSFTKRHEVSIS
jgi:hypothetical protein